MKFTAFVPVGRGKMARCESDESFLVGGKKPGELRDLGLFAILVLPTENQGDEFL